MITDGEQYVSASRVGIAVWDRANETHGQSDTQPRGACAAM